MKISTKRGRNIPLEVKNERQPQIEKGQRTVGDVYRAISRMYVTIATRHAMNSHDEMLNLVRHTNSHSSSSVSKYSCASSAAENRMSVCHSTKTPDAPILAHAARYSVSLYAQCSASVKLLLCGVLTCFESQRESHLCNQGQTCLFSGCYRTQTQILVI